MFYITGDTHGQFQHIEAFCERIQPSAKSHQLSHKNCLGGTSMAIGVSKKSVLAFRMHANRLFTEEGNQ